MEDNIKGSRILIVDDILENIQVLGGVLRKYDFQIAVAMSGKEALLYLEQKKPDLILLDIMMPEINGIEVCKRIKEKEETKDIPIIFLSAKSEKEDILEGLRAGAVDYITKPFYAEELLSRVTTHLKLKKTTDMLIAQNKILEQLNHTKNKFFSIIAHDIRNTVASIAGFSDILQNQYDNLTEIEKQKSVQFIYYSSSALLNVLENLLEWAKIQMDKMEIMPIYFDLMEECRLILEFVDMQAKTKKITLKLVGPHSLQVFADKNMIRSVLINLISNAIKFTHPDGIVEVFVEKEETFCKVSIKDSGVGIKEELLSQIFTMGSHLKTSGTANEKGTGLGLILCKEFVEKNGGKIWVESTFNVGSIFYFTIPLSEKI